MHNFSSRKTEQETLLLFFQVVQSVFNQSFAVYHQIKEGSHFIQAPLYLPLCRFCTAVPSRHYLCLVTTKHLPFFFPDQI